MAEKPIPVSAIEENAASVRVSDMLRNALSLHQEGKLMQAQQVCVAILRICPTHFESLYLLGRIAGECNDDDRACALLQCAIQACPGNPAVYLDFGNALGRLGRAEFAIASYETAIALRPEYAEAYHNLGNALLARGSFAEAASSYERAIAGRPEFLPSRYGRARALQGLGRQVEAVAAYDEVIARKPDYPEAHYDRANVLQSLGRSEDAVAGYDRAIALRPEYAEAYNNRGNALLGLGQPDAACRSYSKAVEVRPGYAEAHANLGNALLQAGKLDDAIRSCDRAITADATLPEAYWNKSMAILLSGDLEAGWPLYEWRWKTRDFSSRRRNFPQPAWDGMESISGRTILLHGEQGLGDWIQFCRYIPKVKALGARVVIEVPDVLTPLLGELDGVDECIPRGEPLPSFDIHCSVLSLPYAFRTTTKSIPAAATYLRSDDSKRELWRRRLGQKARRRVGLVCSGSASHKGDRARSIPLRLLLPELPDCCDYTFLQKDLREYDKEVLTGTDRIPYYGDLISDFSDAAALCDLMDVIVSVDTSVAHLAGALGKPTWILLPFAPDWRWMLNRSDSPWYPSVHLLRQLRPGDWADPLARLRSMLSDGHD